MNQTRTGLLAWLVIVLPTCGSSYAQTSEYAVKEVGPCDEAGRARITVEICDLTAEDKRVPVRAIVTTADGSHVDGSGHGLYADGRFYADGSFEVAVPPGQTWIELSSGPDYVPLDIREDLSGGRAYHITARLYRWFSPAAHGWYCGDNHVHALHDAHATVKASLAYTALQGRANGLNWITEAGSNVPYDDIDRLDSASFLLRYAPEQRPGAYVGHVNTPGIRQRLDEEALRKIYNRPLPVQALKERVHRLGGVVTHTHPLSPPYQLHWMGATEFFSDIVMGNCADLFDIDSRATEWLWFMALNLRNRVGVSGSTDSALGRVRTSSPGDRRVYCHAKEFTYPAIVEALREGRTFATNGSAIFPFFQIDGHGPGEVIELTDERSCKATITIHTRDGVRTAQVYRNGVRIWAVDLTGQSSPIELKKELEESQTCWYVLRVEDAQGNWAITSPIYFEAADRPARERAEALLLEISNCTRFIELRRQFYAHIITTVADGETIATVELLRDEEVQKAFSARDGDGVAEGRVPVNGLGGEYAEGWVWHPNAKKAAHFQADYPVTDSGWYAVRLRTDTGRILTSESIRFDADHPNSRTLSVAHVRGGGTSLRLLGYGEEMPLAEITLPFEGDHWWYPRNTWWQLTVDFGQGPQQFGGGWKKAESCFRVTSSN